MKLGHSITAPLFTEFSSDGTRGTALYRVLPSFLLGYQLTQSLLPSCTEFFLQKKTHWPIHLTEFLSVVQRRDGAPQVGLTEFCFLGYRVFFFSVSGPATVTGCQHVLLGFSYRVSDTSDLWRGRRTTEVETEEEAERNKNGGGRGSL